jgi:hypothetical protein
LELSFGMDTKAIDTAQRKVRADAEWPPTQTPAPFVEVAFSPEHTLAFSQTDLRRVVEEAPIQIEHGFPFVTVSGYEVRRATAWGWFGRIPFADLVAEGPPPTYLWLLSREGAFLDRDHLWEDSSNSVIRGAVGLFHLVGRTILLLRFLESFARKLGLRGDQRFRAAVSVVGIRGRLLLDETGSGRRPGTRGAAEDRVEARADFALQQLEATALSICTTLVEDLAEQFGREDLRRHQVELVIKRAATFLGREYVLPGGG